jgi:nucleoside-diphosphate-sugar epimerase
MERKETVLVTGGSGFLGLHIMLQLLQKGYHVRTTLRSLKNKDKIISTLKANGIKDLEKLSFAEAELTNDTHWAEAMQGCQYVLSVASPVFFDIPADENEAVRPAVEGVLRVLKFALQTGVKRVVMTSNFGAVGFSQTDKDRETTEADWTDQNLKGLSVYEKSKLLAERAAWDFMAKAGGDMEFATINPVAIFGPSLDGHISGSLKIITNMLDGTWKRVPPIPLNLVDVRDVAALHILAMEKQEAKGQRFIATANGKISMLEIAALIKKNRPEIAGKVSTSAIPTWLIKSASLFNQQAREGALFLRMNRKVSNAKAKEVLDWKPMATNETIVLDSVDSMVKFNPGKY